MPLSDAELIARVLLDDDHDAFGELVVRHQSSLRAWLRQLTQGDVSRADDLAQETFVIAYRQLKNFRGDGRFPAWLFTIAHRRFCSEARQRQRREFVSLEEFDSGSLVHPDDSFRDSDVRQDLERAMSALTLEQRAAITLCYQQGLTHEEAAAVLDSPLGTVKTNILRGKERLLRYFKHVETAA